MMRHTSEPNGGVNDYFLFCHRFLRWCEKTFVVKMLWAASATIDEADRPEPLLIDLEQG